MKGSILIRALVAGAVALALSGCATTTRTETRRVYAEAPSVAVGDEVRVTTRDGRRLDFRVTEVDEASIKGKGISVARADVASVKVASTHTVTTREVNAEPAAKAVGFLALGYAAIVIVALIVIF